ncbi:MAG: hypothetical protein WCI64_08920 [Chlorobium sp.]
MFTGLDIEQLGKQYLSFAEELFGTMSSDWEYGGIEINDNPPHLRYYPDIGKIVISLSEKVRNDDVQLCFQLSHEICHILYPVMNTDDIEIDKRTVLNEGISTFFSILVIKNLCDIQFIIDNLREYNTNYYGAYVLVNELMSLDFQAIKKLRIVEPMINLIKLNHFDDAGVILPIELKIQLLQKFN